MSLAEARRAWVLGVLALLMGLAPLTAYLWPLGFAAFTPIAAILLIAAYRPRGVNGTLLILLFLTVYGLVSVSWSPVFSGAGPMDDYASAETQTWGKLAMQLGIYAVLMTVAAGVQESHARRLAWIFALGAVALSVVLLIEGTIEASLYQSLRAWIGDPIRPDLARKNVAQATYALALMAWPAAGFLWRRGRRASAVIVMVSAALSPILLHAWAPVAAVAAGGLARAAFVRFGGRAGLGLGAILVSVILAAPWLVLAAEPLFALASGHIGQSWAARLDIWLFTAEQTLAHPLFGWGLDASRAFQPFMLHPHSALLQIWLELGLVGAVLAAGFWFLLARRAARFDAPGLAALASYFTIGALSFGVWQEWWLGLGALTCLWVMFSDARLDPAPSPPPPHADGD